MLSISRVGLNIMTPPSRRILIMYSVIGIDLGIVRYLKSVRAQIHANK